MDKGNAGGGFVEYIFEKPDHHNKERKLSYAYPFTGWNWIIMAGLYTDDVEASINKLVLYDEKEKKHLTMTFFLMTLSLLIIGILFLWFVVGRSVTTIINELFKETEILTIMHFMVLIKI